MAAASPLARRVDLDVLRLVAVLLLFVFHTGKVFDSDPAYHVKSTGFEQPSALRAAADATTWWMRRWQMPLLFAIAGWAAAGSIRRHGARGFLARRAARLGAPLLLGLAVLCPPIKWLELLQGRTLRPSGLRLVPPSDPSPLEVWNRFFTRLDHFTWSHLWFLVYLLVFTVILTVLLALPARTRRDAAAATGSRRERAPGALALLPILPLVLLELALRSRFGDYPNLYSDWANVASFGTYFLLGATLAARPALETSLRAARPLTGGLLFAATLLAATASDAQARVVLGAVVGWSAVAWALGSASAVRWPGLLASPGWRRAALAVYVLHHTPLLLLAFALTRGGFPPVLAAIAIPLVSATLTAVLVTLAARWRPTRRALGLDPATA